MNQFDDESIVIGIDIDGCVYPYGVFRPPVLFFEEASKAKAKFLISQGRTDNCLAVSLKQRNHSAPSLFQELKSHPTTRFLGKKVHNYFMEYFLQCKKNPELIACFNEVLKIPNIKIVFFSNGAVPHARNVVRMVLGEDLADSIPIVCSRQLDNGYYRKPEKEAYLALNDWMDARGIKRISKFFFIDDSLENLRGAQAAFESLNIPVQCLRIGISNPNDTFPSYGTLAEALGGINASMTVGPQRQQASR